MPLLIAIDGPAASGKGTLARRLADYYHLPHLDTGLTYRATARWNHETTGGMALCSSIYVRRDGAWKLALHHHSLVQG